MKRREGLRKNNEDEKRRKDKEREKRQREARPVKKVRVLADGSIGLGHGFKIGRTGLIVMVSILVVLTLFMGGMAGWYDQFAPDDQKAKFTAPVKLVSFEECEAIDFNSDLCNLEYKFTRTYADGATISQYAEEDPFVNVDPNENKYTPEEQDFLPPSDGLNSPNVILDFIFGWFPPEAHADERNHFSIGIYKSKSCKALTSLGSDKCPSYGLLAEQFDNTNEEFSGYFKWSDADNDIYRVASNYTEQHNYYQYAGIPTILAVDPDARWFTCCMDVQIIVEPHDFVYYSQDELSVDVTIWDFDAEQRIVKDRIRELALLNEQINYIRDDEDDDDLDNDGITDENDGCDNEKEDFNGFEDTDGCPDDRDNDGIKGEHDKCPSEKEDFNGYEDDDGCMDDVDSDGIFGNRCLTAEWREEYIREHIDDEVTSRETNTRNPPADCFVDMDECPFAPENFNRFEDDDGCPDLSDEASQGRLVTHKNIYIDGCSFARVAANMTLITQTINYFWNSCEGKSPELTEYTYIPSTPINHEDHMWYKYSEWLVDKLKECRIRC